MSATAIMVLVDLIAITILTAGIYYPRHRRSDLVVAFLGVNVGVLAVSEVLGSSTVGAGLGMGLFGVLSIIRLRSTEISQREVAYYFASLALGLITGLSTELTVLNTSLMALLVGVVALADSRLFSSSVRTQEIQMDSAIADPEQLRTEISRRLDAEVVSVSVERIDYVNDTTTARATVRTGGKRQDAPRKDAPRKLTSRDVQIEDAAVAAAANATRQLEATR
ncbi:MAG TPA: DUF4956 domain-containing protein [Candidatus Corynebacterium avicola]|uniref:DUF4956 domain-containing protein n=1 Tax=Candidatus Corynebacterium avicola TaxID=2838527 RepID=A0A9D1RQK9_9CORY|nr:DUF4956 domain-containing protein [Candidatus Corynebacterium avicola]